MSEAPYNPDDPAFLASMALDEVLAAEERRKLEELLAASETLRGESEGFRAIDRLKRWAAGPVELDWDAHAALSAARAAGDDDEQDLREVDRLLERWGRAPAVVDEDAFVASIMARVAPRSTRSRRRQMVFRIGLPLAAAAAMAIAVTGVFWSPAAPQAVVQLAKGPVPPVSYDPVEPTRVALAVFDRAPLNRDGPGGVSTISFIAVGAAPVEEWIEESPPL